MSKAKKEQSNILCVKLYNLLSYIMCNPNENRELNLDEYMSVNDLIDTLKTCQANEKEKEKLKPLKLFKE